MARETIAEVKNRYNAAMTKLEQRIAELEAEVTGLRQINLELTGDKDELAKKYANALELIEQIHATVTQPRPAQQTRRTRGTVEYTADIENKRITIGDQVFESDKDWKRVRTGTMVGGIIIPLDGKGRLPKSNLSHILSKAGFKPVVVANEVSEEAPDMGEFIPNEADMPEDDPLMAGFLPS